MKVSSIDNYLGSKGNSGLYQFIINKMPKHDVYIEPFFGTGVIYSKKIVAPIANIAYEVHSDLCSAMSMRYPFIDIRNDNSLYSLYSSIDHFIYTGAKILIYLDPPYLWSTRSDLKFSKYKHEMSDLEHRFLLTLLLSICDLDNVFIMLSGYKSDLYMSMLHGWSYFEFETMSRGGKRVESLWTNFNPDNFIKHDYSYVGFNYTDRQRIKRKSLRWLKNFESMSLDEKCSIYQKLKLSMEDQNHEL